jgi:hypothetical protein
MQILSAVDAITPAFSRTKLVLFSPFRTGRTWKLAATAYLASTSTIFLPIFLVVFLFLPQLREAGGSIVTIIVAVAAIVATLVAFLFLYLFTRLRFAYFDIVLNRGEFVAPAWRKYGPQSFKWTIFKAILGTLLTAAITLPIAAFVRHFIVLASSLRPGEQPPPDLVLGMMSGYFGAYFVIGIFLWLSSLLSDFVVPSLALENTTLSEAFRRLGQLIRNEPGQFTAYAFLKMALSFAGMMAAGLGLEIVFLIVILVVFLIAGGIGALLHLAGIPSAALMVAAVIVMGLLYIVFIYGVFLANGVVMTFLEAYTLYFLGGRYPMLGDLLTASTPPPPPPPPAPVYPAYAAPPPAPSA